jgi:hypothetical protein
MVNLFEGMRGGDLEDLVLPMISVDEYESKIDDEAIVIAFYVSEQGAAEDLNRFLQRSPVELIDTEISPAPDSKGYYMVFVELLKNNTLPENITLILEEVAPLANIEAWKMQLRGHDDLVPFSEEDIAKAIVDPKEAALAESILAFLQPSDLLDATVQGGVLKFDAGYEHHEFEIVGFGPLAETLETCGLTEGAISMKLHDVAFVHNIATLLGTGWSVNKINEQYLVHHEQSENILLMRS